MTLDANTLLLIGGGACVLCVVGLILSVGLQLLGALFQLFGGIFELIFGIADGIASNPCGCVVLIGALLLCGGILYFVYTSLSACGTPQATNFCSLFGL
jgi:hypothetical protein